MPGDWDRAGAFEGLAVFGAVELELEEVEEVGHQFWDWVLESVSGGVDEGGNAVRCSREMAVEPVESFEVLDLGFDIVLFGVDVGQRFGEGVTVEGAVLSELSDHLLLLISEG